MIRTIIDRVKRWFAAPNVVGDPRSRDADWPSREAYERYEQFGGPKR